MSRNVKRRNRVLLILAGAVVLAGGGAATYWRRQSQMDTAALEARERGLAAVAAKDYAGVLDGLGRYVRRFSGRGVTAEDFRMLAQARRMIPEPNSAHLSQAIALARRAAEMDPKSRAAQDDLLDLYTEAGFAAEALTLVERRLAETPNDARMLRMQCEILVSQRQYARALEVAIRLTEVEPQRFDGLGRALDLLFRAEKAPRDVDAWIDAVALTRKDDPRVPLLRATTLLRRRETDAANALFDRLVADKVAAADDDFVAYLVAQLDAAERFGDALTVLRNCPPSVGPALRVEFLRRLAYRGELAEVLERTESVAKDLATAGDEELALRALALRATGRAGEVEPLVAELRSRPGSAPRAWATFVRTTADDRGGDLAAAVRDLAAAADAVPSSALIRMALGDARAALADRERAVQHWMDAAILAPSWARPLVAAARARLGVDPVEALAASRAALRRAPRDVDTVNTFVQAVAESARELAPDERAALVREVDRLREVRPAETGELLPDQLGVLLLDDRPAAERRLREALASGGGLSEGTLLRLARLSSESGFALEMNFLDIAEKAHGATPSLALARGVLRGRTDGADAGVREFDAVRARTTDSVPAGQWELARASLLDAVQRPAEACRAWLEAADARPADLTAQLGALASPGVWADREGVDRLIERVKGLTGEDGVTWRLARARRILGDPASTNKDVGEAASLAEYVTKAAERSVVAWVYLAQANERLGMLPLALEHMQTAAHKWPENSWIALELARLAQLQGQTDVARREVQRALASGDLAPQQAERAAFLLALQGDEGRGAEILAPLASREAASRNGLLLLARLYGKLGQTDRAVLLCDRLLARPDVDVIELAADLHATAGRRAEAETVLARLDQLGLAPGEREIRLAAFKMRWGDTAAARDLLEKAVSAAPSSERGWTELLRLAAATGDVALLDRVLGESRAQSVETVRAAVQRRDVLRAAVAEPRLRAAAVAFVSDDASRDAVAEALAQVMTPGAGRARIEDAAREVRRIADRSSVLALQILAAQMAMEAGDFRTARELVRAATARAPGAAEAWAGATEVLARCGLWSDALESALRWKDLADRGDMRPDLFVARLRLRLDRPAEAAEGLAPIVPGLLESPANHEMLVATYVLALHRAGKARDADAVRQRLFSASPRFAVLAAEVGPDWMGDAAAAESWLRACDPHIPAAQPDARFRLACAWASAWERHRSDALLAGARAELTRLAADPAAPAAVHFVAGTLSQQSGDTEAAKRSLQAALARDPAFAPARNNLAVLLLGAGEVPAALAEAEQAVRLAPQQANYQDTLSMVLGRSGDAPRSVAAARKAVELDPFQPERQVRLAEALDASGDRTGAETAANRADELAARRGGASEDVKSRLAALRARWR